MAQLDKLLERTQEQQELVLETKKEPMLTTAAGSRVMVNQQLSSQQIIALLVEIAPTANREGLLNRQQATFEYSVNGKRFSVSFLAQGEQVRGVLAFSGYG
jgi:hypothetical protein